MKNEAETPPPEFEDPPVEPELLEEPELLDDLEPLEVFQVIRNSAGLYCG
jgi:hypothetical protein